MQVPPVPQIHNDLLRPQASQTTAPSVPDALSKNGSEDSRARFSDHLNDERKLSSDRLDASESTRSGSGDAIKEPSEASLSRSIQDENSDDGVPEDEFQAGIADSSQDVPSDLAGRNSDSDSDVTAREAIATGVRNGEPAGQGNATQAAVSSASTRQNGTIAPQGGLAGNGSTAPGRPAAGMTGEASPTNGTPLPEANVSSAGLRDSVTKASAETALKGEATIPAEGSKSSPDGGRTKIDLDVMKQPDGMARTEAGGSGAETGDQRSGERSNMRSLTELLSRQGITMEAPSSELDPAMGRVREINQTVAHEQAVRSMGGNATHGTGISSTGVGSGVVSGLGESGALEARTSVLSEVLSRSANETKIVERATMVASRGLNALASQRGGSLSIRLDPPGLGQVMIRMSVSNGVVQAELHASNAAGRVVMERGLETLRASLESRGLSVERLSVQAGTASSESQGTRSESNAQDEGQRQADREEQEEGRQDAAGRESRGRDQERGVRSRHDDPNQNQQDVSFTQIMSEDAA